MDIVKRFRLKSDSRMALVGSGGKTTLMYALARDYQSRVILTTTTHLAIDQLEGADRHYKVNTIGDLPDPQDPPDDKILLFTGNLAESERVNGPNLDILIKLVELADHWGCPLIVEADGARKLPLKAPAKHEPAIPDWINVVIVTAGLAGLGKPLNEKWVHRPELFSDLVKIPLGMKLTSHHLVKALTSSRGGLKHIPPEARRILLINQIDSFPNWRTLHRQLDIILKNYHAVGFAVLEDQMLLEVHERIGGIVLAAGGSERFGSPKQLLDWGGNPLVKLAANTALAGGLDPVVVVCGSDYELVKDALEGIPVDIRYNPDWQLGQSTSVKTGIDALPDDVGGAVFLLVDQPFVSPNLIQKLRQTQALRGSLILLPQVRGKQANPVFFNRELFAELANLKGDAGGRVLFERFSPSVINWEDDRIRLDIDTPEDYQRLLNHVNNSSPG